MENKSFVKDCADKISKNHNKIINIMMIALFALVIIFVQFFGIRVNIGSNVFDDGRDYYVRQNIFQMIDTATSTFMTQEEAQNYVDKVNKTLKEEYNIQGFNTYIETPSNELNPGAFESLNNFGVLAEQLGKDASKINLLKYKFSFAVAVSNMDTVAHKQSFGGSRVISMTGQLMLVILIPIMLLIISLIFLALAIVALVKKREFKRAKFSLILLLTFSLVNIFLFSLSSFMSMNWAAILITVLIVLSAIAFAVIKHLIMDRKEFSFTMFIHNAVLLVGSVLAFALFIAPIFKLTSDIGNSTHIGWAYITDYSLAEMSYMSAVMSYVLTQVMTMVMLMLPAIILLILIVLQVNRFLGADYYFNETKVLLIILAVINGGILLLMSILSIIGQLGITSQYIDVRLNFPVIIIQFLVLIGLIVFESIYKVRPVKKDLVIK